MESLAVSDDTPSWNAAAPLSPRENEILVKIGNGMRNRQIATELGISEATVKVHLRRIYGKLGIDSRLKLVLYSHGKRLHLQKTQFIFGCGSVAALAAATEG